MIRHLPDLSVRPVLVGEPVRRFCVKPHSRYAFETVVRILHFPAVAILDSRSVPYFTLPAVVLYTFVVSVCVPTLTVVGRPWLSYPK